MSLASGSWCNCAGGVKVLSRTVPASVPQLFRSLAGAVGAVGDSVPYWGETAENGHYVALRRDSACEHSWRLLDDAHVRAATEQDLSIASCCGTLCLLRQSGGPESAAFQNLGIPTPPSQRP